MADWTFEVGFDWSSPPTMNGLYYPLQICLVDTSGTVFVPTNPNWLKLGDTLSFRVYDITAYPSEAPRPRVLQVLFSAGSSDESAPFSPILVRGQQESLFASMDLQRTSTGSVAFSVDSGWLANWTHAVTPLTFELPGRFELAVALSVVNPGEMARFYRVDPEMVIGDDT